MAHPHSSLLQNETMHHTFHIHVYISALHHPVLSRSLVAAFILCLGESRRQKSSNRGPRGPLGEIHLGWGSTGQNEEQPEEKIPTNIIIIYLAS